MFKYLKLWLWSLGSVSVAFAGGYGFDVVTSAPQYAANLTAAALDGRAGTWMRVRGLTGEPGLPVNMTRSVATERAGLLALRARGVKTMVILRWDSASWSGGVRAGGGFRLPSDLREAFERGRWLGLTYGDVVDGWEIDNEPDIDFIAENPETYAAYLKAIFLGLHAGVRSSQLGATSSALSAEGSSWLTRKRGGAVVEERRSQLRVPLVIMAPLALPPGPFFERLWANGVASYTDGFNFHYYGYAEDFTGVYRQFEAAITELGAKSCELGAKSSQLRRLPVFITEYGYGLLDAEARDSVEGRVRQWWWFRHVAHQINALRPEGPMAFLVNPYFEAGVNEFGLSMANQPKFFRDTGVPAGEGESKRSPGVSATDMAGAPRPQLIPSVRFEPADFGARKAAPWMERIGQKLGDSFASPALAYLWDYAERNPYRPLAWQVLAGAPSPVVVDFIAGMDMSQWKSGGGYMLSGAERRTGVVKELGGSGRVVLYNFSNDEIAGRWLIEGKEVPQSVMLAAGERREFPVEFKVQAERFVGEERRVIFTPDNPRWARAELVTRLFPDTASMRATTVINFNFTAEVNRERATTLLKRPVAVGEPVLQEQGRWLVTQGVKVEESGGLWRFHVEALPAEPLRPAMVELPLPMGFKIEPETMILLERRNALGTATSVVKVGRQKPNEGIAGTMMDVYFRTENGNLFQTWPRLPVTGEWASYAENTENFTMGFFGRAAMPWRLSENRPVSLVFFLRAAELPMVFEVKGARIARLGLKAGAR